MFIERETYMSHLTPNELSNRINTDQEDFSGSVFKFLSNPFLIFANQQKASFTTAVATAKMKFNKTEKGTEVKIVSRPNVYVLFVVGIILLMILLFFVVPTVTINGDSNAPYYKRFGVLFMLIIPAMILGIAIGSMTELVKRTVNALGLKKALENEKKESSIHV